jgi:hypothetical protein
VVLAFREYISFCWFTPLPILTQLFPKRWITNYAGSCPSDGNNVNFLSLVGELALFSHKGPLNKLCSSALCKIMLCNQQNSYFFSFSHLPLTLHQWAIFFQAGRIDKLITCEILHSVSVNQSSNNYLLLFLCFCIFFSPPPKL